MNRSILVLVIYLLLGTGLLHAQEPLPKLEPDTATVVKDSNTFAIDLYGKLAEQDGNLFFSPYSISSALAMTYRGARGETAGQMAKTLHFTLGQERLHPAFGRLTKEIQGKGQVHTVPPKYQLQIANQLWGQKDYHFLPDFLKDIESNYGSGLKEVDFIRASEEARQTINSWVEEQTKNKIKELIPRDILTDETRLVLTNAIYFKAAWKYPFTFTTDGDFQLGDGKKVRTKLMDRLIFTNYFKGDDFEALELPYTANDLSMIVLLPSQASGLASFEKKLTANHLTQWLSRLSDHQVEVTLPRFKVTSQFMLQDVLSEMGMPSPFSPGRADFSGMTKLKSLFIKHVIHKAFVDVNEDGTEAAAATAVTFFFSSGSKPPPLRVTFRADHPFVYLIRDNRTGSILFLGRVVNLL